MALQPGRLISKLSSSVAAGRHRLGIHRARRREAERAQAAAVTPLFTGDDGMVHPGAH